MTGHVNQQLQGRMLLEMGTSLHEERQAPVDIHINIEGSMHAGDLSILR